MLYKTLINLLKATLLIDPIIKDSEFGAIQQYVEHNKIFPFSFIEPGLITTEEGFSTYSFTIYFLDQLQKTQLNRLDIISNLEKASRDFTELLEDFWETYAIKYIHNTTEIVYYTQDEGLCGVKLNFSLKIQDDC